MVAGHASVQVGTIPAAMFAIPICLPQLLPKSCLQTVRERGTPQGQGEELDK
jgi:hypothetical protein